MKKRLLFIFTSIGMSIIVALSILLPCLLIKKPETAGFGEYNVKNVQALSFKDNSDEFKILQLTDTHIMKVSELESLKNDIQELIDRTNPDLIIVTGDGIWSGDKYVGEIIQDLKPLVPEYVKTIDSFGIKWAFVLGNHDFNGSVTIYDWLDAFKTADNLIFATGPDQVDGLSNYAINIKNGNDYVYSLILFDSLRKDSYKNTLYGGYYNEIKQSQVDWYEWNIKGISKAQYGEYNPKEGKVVRSMCFYHIPQIEFFEERKAIIDEYGKDVLTPDGRIATVTDDNQGRDDRLYPARRSNLIQRAIELQSTTAMFVGHLHRDRSNYKHRGIELVQGTKTTRNAFYYGMNKGDKAIEIGGNLITITKDAEYSWQRIYLTILN